jgi:nicotinamidase-related amidase
MGLPQQCNNSTFGWDFMLLAAEDSQLVLMDYQTRLMPAMHDAAATIANACRLVRFARAVGVPVWGIEQAPQNLGPMVPELAGQFDKTLWKTSFSGAEVLGLVLFPPPKAASGNARSLPKHLQKPAAPPATRNTVVIAGCEAHICLLQTALELLDQDMDVWVVTDACTSRTERSRDAAFDRLAANGAELITAEMVAFEWLRDSEHVCFKEIQALIN